MRPTPKDGNDDPEAVYGLQFTYAAQEKAAAQQEARQTWKEKQDARMKEVAENRLNTDVFYGPQNWRYMAQGQFRDIAPIEAHDNGRITAFRYPGNMPVPSVFIVSNGGSGLPTPAPQANRRSRIPKAPSRCRRRRIWTI